MGIMEAWKDIKDYKGYYQVSNLGNVKSLERTVKAPSCTGGKITRKERLLKQKICKKGYCHVVLMKNAIPKYITVHRLVALAFILNPFNKPEVNHKKGIKNDNRVEQLEWVTYKENLAHAIKILDVNKGENNGRAILKEKDVREIKIRLSNGCKNIDMAKLYNVHPSTIQDIKHKRNWKWV